MTASSHRPAGSGDSRRASAAAPGSAAAREGGAQPTPRARTDPRPLPAEALALVVTLALPHASVSGTSRLQISGPRAGSTRAWREPKARPEAAGASGTIRPRKGTPCDAVAMCLSVCREDSS